MSPTGSSTSSTDADARLPVRRRGPGRAGAAGAAGALVVLAALLAACGFQPLYGERSRAGPAALAAIDIDIIEDRTGQMLRNELLERFNAGQTRAAARYALKVDLAESLQDLAIRKDEVATRANLVINASFVLRYVADGTTALSGSARSTNSYNILASDFATLSARADARRRAVRQLADDLKQRVSVWLLQTGGAPRAGVR